MDFKEFAIKASVSNSDELSGDSIQRFAELILAHCAKIAEGWESENGEYKTCGNGNFWDAGTNYDQGRIDAAACIRSLLNDKINILVPNEQN